MATLEEKRFAEIAVTRQFITPEQAAEATAIIDQGTEPGQQKTLTDTLIQKGFINESQKQAILKAVAESGPLRIGEFEIISELGRGGMGAVYKAREVSLDRVCALKLLPAHMAHDASLVTRFKREAQACAKLDHPNIVRAYRVGEAENTHYFAMEFIEGSSVEKVIEKGPMPIDKAVDIIRQVGKALAHAHKAGMIHRDIKPGNILVTKDGVAKLADLGLVREMNADMTRVTQSGTGMGTPAYMPPEQATGAKNADARSDIYALGATMYHMVVGDVPYKGDSAYDVVKMHMEGRLKSPRARRPDVPSWLDLVILKMMQKKPENRFQTADELLAALDRGSPVAAPTAQGVTTKKMPVDKSWHLEVKQKDGSIKHVKADTETLRRLLADGKLPLTTLARRGDDVKFKPVSEYSVLMEAVTSAKSGQDKRGGGQLKTLYEKTERAAARKRQMVKIKKVFWLVVKIGIVVAIVVAAIVYWPQIKALVQQAIRAIKGQS
jgi:serine/threonine protein kinase